MVIKERNVSNCSEVKWIGSQQSAAVPQLLNKSVAFYKRCIIGPLTLSVGDYVLVSNADAVEPDTEDGCDVAKILHLYELREMSDKYPCRALVQWYSRPFSIPEKEFDSDDICIDFDKEVVKEYRLYDPDISLETIFCKCTVITGTSLQTVKSLMKLFGEKQSSQPMFVCRYKFIKVNRSYRLVPLQFSNEVATPKTQTPRKRHLGERSCKGIENCSKSAQKYKAASQREGRRRASVAATNEIKIDFVDMDAFASANKVSPIKIIGGRSVVRLSTSAKKKRNNEIRDDNVENSPLADRNGNVSISMSRVTNARRNLNQSLESGANSSANSDCLNYSIVKSTPNAQHPSNDMKIKLRLSERHRPTRRSTIEDDPLAIDENFASKAIQYQRKRLGTATKSNTPISTDIYSTPSKKQEEAPVARRKSILKSATNRTDGTPKRSIQLSNVVERRIFQDDEIIATPKRVRTQKSVKDDSDDDYTPRKYVRKTGASARRGATEATSPVSTQKHKLIRSGDLTPSMESRNSSKKPERKSNLQLTREQLHVSVVPKSLPCREKEFENIYTFLEGKIEDQCGGCMYISGVPGTGKTATVTSVIRMLQQRVSKDELSTFEYVEVNGMRLTEPRQAYVQIYKQLTGKTVTWEQAHALLEKRFTTAAPRRVTTVLLVDELDILCNRRQDVVYNLLDWPTKSAARLVVVTIANTMDLPERLLMGKVTSRLGLTRLTFQPYTHKQLQEIVTARLSGADTFKGDAVQLVARKVAAVSGDARRALDICRRATEIAYAHTETVNKPESCVSMMHVQQALNEMIASAKVQAIKNCSEMEQIFLQAVVAEVTRTGVEETTFLGVYTQVEILATFMGASIPTTGRALRICSKLGAERLLICEHSRNDIFQKILLNVSVDDIHYALRVNQGNA